MEADGENPTKINIIGGVGAIQYLTAPTKHPFKHSKLQWGQSLNFMPAFQKKARESKGANGKMAYVCRSMGQPQIV